MFPYVLITPSSRGLSTALARYYLQNTDYAVFATHRSSDEQLIRNRIFGTDSGPNQTRLNDSRLTLMTLELTSEDSIASAANELARRLPSDARLHTAWITGGVLHPEKRPQDIDYDTLLNSFQVNSPASRLSHQNLTRWVHISARVGSISDNRTGGWYSYRSSKAALNQVIKSFDIQLQTQSRTHSKNNATSICVGVHPGTVKTDLSKSYWGQDSKGRRDPELMEPEDAAEKLVQVVENLREHQRGRVWDWKGALVEW